MFFIVLVYDKRGRFHTLTPTSLKLGNAKGPKIKSVVKTNAKFSLADSGFDSSVETQMNEKIGSEDELLKTRENERWRERRKKGEKFKGRKNKSNKRKRKKERRKWMEKYLKEQDKNDLEESNLNVNYSEQPLHWKAKLEGLEQRLPGAIIIGSKKCGTRALLKQLSLHSRILTAGREIHFFDRHYNRGLEWYRKQMPLSKPGEITMEKTPGYFITREAPERIYSMMKKFSLETKFIVIVRDPVDRVISDYAQGLAKNEKTKERRKSLEERIFLSSNEKIVDENSYLIRIGLYAKHLKKWLKFFALSQIHFVSGEELINKPWKELEAVQKFLNISVEITKENFWFNKTKKFYCVREKGEAEPNCLGETKGRKHPKIDQETIKVMRNFYSPYNKKFYKMVHRDFGWPEF